MRIRTIKPEFFLHEALFDLEMETHLPIRLAFAGLWCAADREGRFQWVPRKLKAQILPYDDVDFSRVLDALTTRGFIVRYASGTSDFGAIPSFLKHQVINNRERDSELPAPPEVFTHHVVDACPTRAPRVDDACLTLLNPALGEGNKEGKGREGNGKPKEGFWEPTPIQRRLNALYRRRDTTKWSDKEQQAFRKVGEINEDDLRLLESYYTADIPKAKDYRRRDLCTFLNNFQGELDRARNFKPQQITCF